MGGFFNLDGPFYRIGNIIADIMILSLVWILFSIPIVTIGASTTALFYVTTRRISNREGYLLRDFWTSFKSNFVQATVVMFILALAGLILTVNIININVVGNMKMVILPFQICFVIELLLLSIYVFPLIARFDMKLKDLLKTGFFMANKHIFTSITCIAMGVAVVLASLMYPLLFVVAMGIYAFGASYMLMRIFKKYRPEIDKDDLLVSDKWS